MGANAEFQIPVIEFGTGSSDLERGTEGWNQLCERVREALETYGCFQVVYKNISQKLRDDTFGLLKQLVEEVPLENKQRNVNPEPFHGFIGPCTDESLYEGYGIVGASNYEGVKNFAQLMWPDGHPRFCENVHTIVNQMKELTRTIWLMIIDSYGLGEKWESVVSNYDMLLRMMKYKAPPSRVYEKAFHSHTDKPVSTIICNDLVSGLEIELDDGRWVKLSSSPGSFFFVVGDPLMAWSNGRIKAVNHRVMMSGNKDRFSMACFAVPAEGTIVSTPRELVDEQHPQLFKDFDFMEFILFAFSEQAKHIESTKQIHAFASLSPPISN
ncbi:Detected protein of unknown function [Hibiscus syriacus]|uniref:2-oxoglutarate-dependent dioxygenase DAO n=1 Tax=Hibiscus syriacus TaxID=106335 RepID=A0A6A2YCL5_HIBSY|nr:probable 2-oxoglutarate-dependent dioxygenase AOP1 [Hibiscus syriacus]KAE8676036.1 Detected protein of unknown function [Hibiscus syriacus]